MNASLSIGTLTEEIKSLAFEKFEFEYRVISKIVAHFKIF